MLLKLYNSLTHKIETFKPIKKGQAGLYTCGPTVYNYAHIGNLRTYVFEDILKRVLLFNNYKVKHIMNITDVGHLTDDADQGEDKMEKGSKREGKTASEIAIFYTKEFKKDLRDLNILSPNKWPLATQYIKEQIDLIKKIYKNGYAYKTKDGIYFNTSQLKNYGKLANLKNQHLFGGKRINLKDKKNITDFALWKFSSPNSKRQMEWSSPWGLGFPGWHIECSAMAIKLLGQPFDIHCGGIDHIPVHHTNEIAQSEAANNKPLANYWLHGEYLLVSQDKMSKSGKNFLTLQTVKDRYIPPLAYRYFLLQTHYRKQLYFSWKSLLSAQKGLNHFYSLITQLPKTPLRNDEKTIEKIKKSLNNDLNIPEALATTWIFIKNRTISLPAILNLDKVFGLKIKKYIQITNSIPKNIEQLSEKRKEARKNKNWQESDKIRKLIEKQGYLIEDKQNNNYQLKNKPL